MNFQKNIVCNFISHKEVKKALLKLRLKNLQNKKAEVVFSFISNHPTHAARMDDVTKYAILPYPGLELQISATTRLLAYISKN